jgi:hypothetical protein
MISFDGTDLGTNSDVSLSFLLDVGTFVERLWNICSFTVLTLLPRGGGGHCGKKNLLHSTPKPSYGPWKLMYKNPLPIALAMGLHTSKALCMGPYKS